MTRKLLGAAFCAAMFVSAPAFAAVSVDGACTNDLVLTPGSSLAACSGGYEGAVLNNANNSEINAALTQLGYNGPAVSYSALRGGAILDQLNGSHTVNFPGVFNGTVYLGVQYDDAKGGPGKSMKIYKISASDLDLITLRKAGSNAVVLAAVPGRLPEAATWGMLLLGFGAVGFALRKAKAISDARFEEKLKRLAAGESA